MRASVYDNLFIACPLTDVESFKKASKNTRKSYLKIEFDGKESYIKMNTPFIFRYLEIERGIVVPIDKNLNKSKRNNGRYDIFNNFYLEFSFLFHLLSSFLDAL